MGLRTSLTRGPGPATSPSSLHRALSVRRLGSPCPLDRDQILGETNHRIVQELSKDILVRNARFLCEVETSWCKTFCPPLRNVVMCRCRVRNIFAIQRHPWARRARQSRSQRIGHLCIQYLRTCFASGTLVPGQAGTLISGLWRHVLLTKSCGASQTSSAFVSLFVAPSGSQATSIVRREKLIAAQQHLLTDGNVVLALTPRMVSLRVWRRR